MSRALSDPIDPMEPKAHCWIRVRELRIDDDSNPVPLDRAGIRDRRKSGNQFAEVKTMPTAATWAHSHPGLSRRPSVSAQAASRIDHEPPQRGPVAQKALHSSLAKSARQEHSSQLGPASDREFHGAVLLVIALYASMALLNPEATWSAVVAQWQSFIDFLSTGLLG